MKTKTQKRTKKHDPRSEAAQREAIKQRKNLSFEPCSYPDRIEVQAIMFMNGAYETVAIFDLRDCYRKRSPLKGIKKAFNKAIAPKRKK